MLTKTRPTMTQKDGAIEFVLKVKAKKGRRKPIDLTLDLNPNDKLLRIDEKLSSKEELIDIFKQVITLLENLDQRSNDYANAVVIDRQAMRKSKFTKAALEGHYDDNFKLPFEKISKVIYSHHSPGEASVSYARGYNGDKPPQL